MVDVSVPTINTLHGMPALSHLSSTQSELENCNDDGTIATCPAMILGFVRYNITLGIPTPQFTGEEELSSQEGIVELEK